MPRVYERKFDWDEAARLRATGLSYEKIGKRLGVSMMAVYSALNPDYREHMAIVQSDWQRSGTCPDCGRRATRTTLEDQHRCWECAAKARATTAREDELQCVTCREWKPDDAFPSNRTERIARRGRHTQCRSCQTTARRDHRRRNREAENAYSREYKRRRRTSLQKATSALRDDGTKKDEG